MLLRVAINGVMQPPGEQKVWEEKVRKGVKGTFWEGSVGGKGGRRPMYGFFRFYMYASG
jgi:hypothetical protein